MNHPCFTLFLAGTTEEVAEAGQLSIVGAPIHAMTLVS